MINISNEDFLDKITANCTKDVIDGRLAGWELEPKMSVEDFANISCAETAYCHLGPGQNIIGRTQLNVTNPNDTGLAPIGDHKGLSFQLNSPAMVGSQLLYYCKSPGM